MDIQHDYIQVLRVFDMYWMASTNGSEIEESLLQFSILPLKVYFYSPVRVLSPSLCVRPLIFSIFSIISLAWQEKKKIYLKIQFAKKNRKYHLYFTGTWLRIRMLVGQIWIRTWNLSKVAHKKINKYLNYFTFSTVLISSKRKKSNQRSDPVAVFFITDLIQIWVTTTILQGLFIRWFNCQSNAVSI